MLRKEQIKQLTSDLDDKLESVGEDDLETSLNGRVALTGTNINWALGAIFYKTLYTNTVLYFSNAVLNKTITLLVTGNYSLTLPSNVKVISGAYDGRADNYIQIHCVYVEAEDPGNNVYWCSISQEVI